MIMTAKRRYENCTRVSCDSDWRTIIRPGNLYYLLTVGPAGFLRIGKNLRGMQKEFEIFPVANRPSEVLVR